METKERATNKKIIITIIIILIAILLAAFYGYYKHYGKTISWEDAQHHVGETATIKGDVAEITYAPDSSGSPIFIDVGLPYPEAGRVTATIWDNNQSALDITIEDIEQQYSIGTTIYLSGEVESYGDAYSIDITSLDQISKTNISTHSLLFNEIGFRLLCLLGLIIMVLVLVGCVFVIDKWENDGSIIHSFIVTICKILNYLSFIACLFLGFEVLLLIYNGIKFLLLG